MYSTSLCHLYYRLPDSMQNDSAIGGKVVYVYVHVNHMGYVYMYLYMCLCIRDLHICLMIRKISRVRCR